MEIILTIVIFFDLLFFKLSDRVAECVDFLLKLKDKYIRIIYIMLNTKETSEKELIKDFP